MRPGWPPWQHLLITGRSAPHELMESADTVTDMHLLKHVYHADTKAQQGIEL